MRSVASQQLSTSASNGRSELPLFSLAADRSLTTCSRADGGAWFNYPFLTGYEHDTETGLDFAQARHYSNTQGRFTGADPLVGSLLNPQSLNRYAYVSNNPLTSTDPSGMFQVQWPASNNGSHGGSGELERAEAEYDGRVQNTRDALAATAAAQSGDWARVNQLMDANPTLEFENRSSDSATATVGLMEDTLGVGGVLGDPGAFLSSTFVITDLPANDILFQGWLSKNTIFGDGDCAQLAQVLAERQGTPMGKAGSGRWKRGKQAMGGGLKRGTVIASGWDPDGYYPNYSDWGNHVAIFLEYLPGGGIKVLEQVHGHVQTRDKTDVNSSSYYYNPNAFYVVNVGPSVPGVPARRHH